MDRKFKSKFYKNILNSISSLKIWIRVIKKKRIIKYNIAESRFSLLFRTVKNVL